MSAPIQSGTNLGNYQIRSFIGAGGMAMVYLAHDLKHDRPVAIKLLHPSLAETFGTKRFRREIEVAARLTHPHIVPLLDSDTADGQMFYVMPYVAGESLRAKLVREKSLSLGEAVGIACNIASALGYAHNQGLVHRDIKPENILLSDGIPLVTDFGIARAITSEAATLTMAGTTLGTPAYMSPEQVEGAVEIDGRSDLYSLGCVFYEMLAGRPPFVGAPQSMAHQHLTMEPAPLTSFRPDTPATLATAIKRSLAKQPADRFSTAAEFIEAIKSDSTSAPTLALGSGSAHSGTANVRPGTKTVPNNLPKDRTRFIGREEELAQGIRLFETTRLLTLTALGGGGKTRLSLKIAEHVANDYHDGVWFLDLSSLTDGARVVDKVAEVLGVRQDPEKDLAQLLLAHVANKRMFLVFDNCEQLVDACAALIDQLLNAGEELRILATSREALGVTGEKIFPLRPLSVPSVEALQDVKAAKRSDAVKLFIDRAQIAQTELKLGDENILEIAEICRRLDGIPLAIELAAARVRVLSISEIQKKLDDRFRLLKAEGRSAIGRHQTLQAAIQWSYEQLSSDEQKLLRSLSVFAGGCSLEFILAVVGDNADEFEIIDLLTRLIDKSLVLVEAERYGKRRYGLLETVRQYAHGRLTEAGESRTAREWHLNAYIALAERAYPERINREQEWANTLTSEVDNFRAALEFARTTDPERYLKLAGGLAWFWQIRSYLREGHEHLATALALTPAQPTRVERARTLWGKAHMVSWQGDPVAALKLMEKVVSMWRELGDRSETGFALESIGWVQLLAGEEEAAKSTFEECLSTQREVGDEYAINRAMVGMCQALVALFEVEEARPLAKEIVKFSEAHGDRRSEHFGWHFLADCALIEGNCEESLELYKRSLVLAAELGDQIETGFEVQGVAMSLAGLALQQLEVHHTQVQGKDSSKEELQVEECVRQLAEQGILLATAAQAEWERIGADLQIRFWNALLERYIETAKRLLYSEALERVLANGRALSFNDAITLACQSTFKISEI